jgi:hypothetical protein
METKILIFKGLEITIQIEKIEETYKISAPAYPRARHIWGNDRNLQKAISLFETVLKKWLVDNKVV